MGFSRQEYWSELPHLPPGDRPDPGIGPGSPVSLALAGGYLTTEQPGKPLTPTYTCSKQNGFLIHFTRKFLSYGPPKGKDFSLIVLILFFLSGPAAR